MPRCTIVVLLQCCVVQCHSIQCHFKLYRTTLIERLDWFYSCFFPYFPLFSSHPCKDFLEFSYKDQLILSTLVYTLCYVQSRLNVFDRYIDRYCVRSLVLPRIYVSKTKLFKIDFAGAYFGFSLFVTKSVTDKTMFVSILRWHPKKFN